VGRREDTARDRIVEEHLGLVRAIARRHARAGEPFEDLVQVGAIGLLKAVDRFDAGKGADLRAIAAPYIEGEIRHHLRDRGHVVRGATGHPVPLDDESGPVAAPDPGDVRSLAAAGLDLLEGRERRIIELRFFEDRRQADIAAELGISQAQVSRLIRRSLAVMREGLTDDRRAGAAPPRRAGAQRDRNGARSGRVLVRMKPELHGRLADTAGAEQQSLNAFITTALEQALEARRPRRRTALLVLNLVVTVLAVALGVVLVVLAVQQGW
jgi:RNA polymerase sigma factor (sigma-70 family)